MTAMTPATLPPAPPAHRLPAHMAFSWTRVGGMVLRYLYLLKSSWTRVVEMVYWPTMQMVLWGLITKFLVSNSSFVARASGLLLAAVLLWDVLFRGQLGVSVMFMEEMYARNLGHLFISPLRPYEFAASLLVMSLLRTLISFGGACLLAWLLFHFAITDMGFPLVAFFINLLVFGWGMGLLICGLLLLYGFAAESLAWAATFALAPIAGIYYPISTLPSWLQPVAWALPTGPVFEGMRAVLIQHQFRTDLLFAAMALNAGYLLLGLVVFLYVFSIARRKGLLLQVGE
ncbi:MAG TPA: ABC transporter permease [bacterium]|nr:ABC transporter permease [bacterium]